MVNNIFVNSAQNNSTVTVGINFQTGWSSHSKQSNNMSIPGSQGHVIYGNLNMTFDNDLLDVQGYDGDINPGI